MAKPNIDGPKRRTGFDPVTGLPVRRQPVGSPRVAPRTEPDGTTGRTGAAPSTVK